MPVDKEGLPGTLSRSAPKIQRTYAKTLDSAHEQYGDEERAHRTAWDAVKHIAKKKGDRWVLKDEPGPSDPQAAQTGRAARERPKRTAGGIDVLGSTKRELLEHARDLKIDGRSTMSKEELQQAILEKT